MNNFDISEDKIVNIYEIITRIVTGIELFSSRPFLITKSLIYQGKVYSIRLLIDTDTIDYVFINRSLVAEICKLLDIEPISLAKPKRLRGYNGQIAKRLITKALYLNLALPGHKELTASIFITNLG